MVRDRQQKKFVLVIHVYLTLIVSMSYVVPMVTDPKSKTFLIVY